MNGRRRKHTNEREIKIKHKRHFSVLSFAERKNVLCLCGCGFYSILDCIIVQLEERMNDRVIPEIREFSLKSIRLESALLESRSSSGLPPDSSK